MRLCKPCRHGRHAQCKGAAYRITGCKCHHKEAPK